MKQVPRSISLRLSDISSSEEAFNQALPAYNNALLLSGFSEKLGFSESERTDQQQRRRRKRKFIWYNPPYSINVKTNIGRKFLSLIRQHFHPRHRLHKIFNMKTIKISYCCMRNISSIISGHNKHILSKETADEERRLCSCPRKVQCLMGGKCLSRNVVYDAEVTNHTDNENNVYIGLTSTTWKERYGVHRQGFAHREHSHGCELTKHIWALKDSGKEFSIRWNILEHVRGRLVGGECKLCVAEKLHIISYPNKDRLLNKNSFSKCMHKARYMLSHVGPQRRGRPKRRGVQRSDSGVT